MALPSAAIKRVQTDGMVTPGDFHSRIGHAKHVVKK